MHFPFYKNKPSWQEMQFLLVFEHSKQFSSQLKHLLFYKN
jgi:hypothetical protein